MRLIDLPRVLLEIGPTAAQPRGAAVRSWCRSWSGGGVALIVLCLAVYLPGLWSIPPVDRDESRFAQASRTMLESGDYIVPRIGSTPRLNKPPLIYWLQAASARVLGDGPGTDGMGQWGNGNIWVFRVPSVLCAIGTVLLTWRMGMRMFDSRAAALGAALLAVCPMVVWDAHQARADQLLLFTTTATMLALYVCWKATVKSGGAGHTSQQGVARAAPPPVVWLLALWVSMGLGILAKGPITPMIAILTAIALSIVSRNARWLIKLRPILGLLVVAAIVGPWVYLVAHRVGWHTYWTTVYDETLGRSTEAKESHWGPPGYHVVLLPVLFWPGSLLTAAAFVRSWRRGLARFTLRNRPEAFLLAWVIPMWLVFEIIATKLPHYTMPMYPAIALLTARTVCAARVGTLAFARSVLDRIGVIVWGGIGAAGLIGSLGLLMEAGGFAIGQNGAGRTLPGLAVAILSTAIGGAVWLVLRHRAVMLAHVLAVLAMVCWCWITLAWVAPRCERFWISSRLLAFVQRNDWDKAARSAPVALVGYEEPSAIFLFRGRASPVPAEQHEQWILRHLDGITLLQSEVGASPPAVGPIGRSGIISGYNYSAGKPIEIHIGGVLPPQHDHFHPTIP